MPTTTWRFVFHFYMYFLIWSCIYRRGVLPGPRQHYGLPFWCKCVACTGPRWQSPRAVSFCPSCFSRTCLIRALSWIWMVAREFASPMYWQASKLRSTCAPNTCFPCQWPSLWLSALVLCCGCSGACLSRVCSPFTTTATLKWQKKSPRAKHPFSSVFCLLCPPCSYSF